MDEDQGNTGAMRSEEEEENHREDVRKLVEMMQKVDDAQEGQWGRVAPNMGPGGSHPQAMSVPERRETQGMRWADCEDKEGKREQEQGGGREKEAEGREEREKEEQKEDRQARRAKRKRGRTKEAREEERRAQEA